MALRRKKTILIFGISSLMGSNLAEFLKEDFRVIGTYRRNQPRIPGVTCLPCDVLSKEEVQMVSGRFKPNYVVYAAGLSSIDDCAVSPDFADALNTVGVFNVSESAQRYKAQFIYISSAFVFGGDQRSYMEMDIPDSNSMYGKTNASAEFYVQKNSLNYLVFRCCKLYGRSVTTNQLSWFEKMQHYLADGRTVDADNYIHSGFIDVYYLAMLIKLCLDQKASNRLFHISSKDVMTHYKFARTYCDVFGDNKELVSKSRWRFPALDTPMKVYQGEELFYQLDVNNIEGYLNIELPTIEESLEFTQKRLFGSKKKEKKQTGGTGITYI